MQWPALCCICFLFLQHDFSSFPCAVAAAQVASGAHWQKVTGTISYAKSPASDVESSSAKILVVHPIGLHEGGPVPDVQINASGTVAYNRSGDEIVLVARNSNMVIAQKGDPVPGEPGYLFAQFTGFSLNDRDQVVFSATFVICSSAAELPNCIQSPQPQNFSRGLFIYSNGGITEFARQGDALPGPGGLHLGTFTYVLKLNNNPTVLFSASVYVDDPLHASGMGLFLYSKGGVQRIALEGDPTPTGDKFRFGPWNPFLSFNDRGEVIFSNKSADSVVQYEGIYRFAGGSIAKLIAIGDAAPDGQAIEELNSAAASQNGNLAFVAGFHGSSSHFFSLRSGKLISVVSYGDPLPGGESFGYIAERPPVINDAGSILFFAWHRVSGAGLYLFRQGKIEKIVTNFDSAAPYSEGLFIIDFMGHEYMWPRISSLGNSDSFVLNCRLSVASHWNALFLFAEDKLSLLARVGDPAPDVQDHSYASTYFDAFAINNAGEVAFKGEMCCSPPYTGIFLAGIPRVTISNGGFEKSNPSGIASGWTTVWNNSGSGDAVQYDSGGSDSWTGNSTLRIYIKPDGGSTFSLSDPSSVMPGMDYIISARMRYNLGSESDAAYFSVIQVDASGNSVGFDELIGRAGDNFWSWELKQLAIRTAPNATAICIRFGLISTHETYLDIDALH